MNGTCVASATPMVFALWAQPLKKRFSQDLSKGSFITFRKKTNVNLILSFSSAGRFFPVRLDFDLSVSDVVVVRIQSRSLL